MTAQLEAHLVFATVLVDGHPWEEDRGRELREALAKIRQRQADPSLYLAVVGEFSSGKSTLINTLICDNLLPTSAVPSTAAATILRFAESPRLEVEFRNGTRQVHDFPESSPVTGEELVSLRLAAAPYITDEVVASELERITLYSPSDVLAGGLVIVDTPGCNVDNTRHVEVAAWAIREVCDAALVVIPAHVPFSQSLAEFLKVHLTDCLHRCMFVVTRIDWIDEAEHELLLHTVEQRVCSMLEIERPVVLAAGPGHAVEELRSRIGTLLRQRRTLVVLEKLASLMSRLYDEIAAGLAELERGYDQAHRALAVHRITDLGIFATEQKQALSGALDLVTAETTVRALDKIHTVRTSLRQSADQAVAHAKSARDLEDLLARWFPAALEAAKAEIERKLTEYLRKLGQVGDREIAAFHDSFSQAYRSLATLGGLAEPIEESLTLGDLQVTIDPSARDLANLARIAAIDKRLDQTWKMAGAAAGTALGCATGCCLAPFLGALIGFFSGKLAAPSLAIQRQKYRSQMETVIVPFFTNAEGATRTVIAEVGRQRIDEADQVVDGYVDRYSQLVDRMIAEDVAREGSLQQRELAVQRDSIALERHRRELSDLQTRLRQEREV